MKALIWRIMFTGMLGPSSFPNAYYANFDGMSPNLNGGTFGMD
jgi:hypothetical protein